jgi:hypothetical protein
MKRLAALAIIDIMDLNTLEVRSTCDGKCLESVQQKLKEFLDESLEINTIDVNGTLLPRITANYNNKSDEFAVIPYFCPWCGQKYQFSEHDIKETSRSKKISET